VVARDGQPEPEHSGRDHRQQKRPPLQQPGRGGGEGHQRAAAEHRARRVDAGGVVALLLLDQGQAGRQDGRKGQEETAETLAEADSDQACGDRDDEAEHEPQPKALYVHRMNPK
jgi:hypothetical protein